MPTYPFWEPNGWEIGTLLSMAGRFEMTMLLPSSTGRVAAASHVVLQRLGMPVARVGSQGEVMAYATNPSGGEPEVITLFFRDSGTGQTYVTVCSECRNPTLVTDWGRNKRHVRVIIDSLYASLHAGVVPPPVVNSWSAPQTPMPPPVVPVSESPQDALMRRYVNGEIDIDQFERLHRELLEGETS